MMSKSKLREPNTMMRQTFVSALIVLAFGATAFACKSGGVGDPCIPNEEFNPDYAGAIETGAQIEDRSFQCETRVCLIDHFRGRVSCPYGNLVGRDNASITNPSLLNTTSQDERDNCYVPGTEITVTSPVKSQCIDRQDNVYCSCRCDGADKNAKYCDCPSGFTCAEVATSLTVTEGKADKYCVRTGLRNTIEGSCSLGSCHDDTSGTCTYTKNSFDTGN